MTKPSITMPAKEHRAIANAAARAFGGDWRVFEYHDDASRRQVEVISSTDRPQRGVTSFSTVRLSDHPIRKEGKVISGPCVELVGACASSFVQFPNLVASCAFEIIGGEFVAPGVIFPGILEQYRPRAPMRNVMFVPPFLWPTLDTLTFGRRKVAWLMLVPVSDAEMYYAVEHGPAKLEERFEEHQIDVYDIDRVSIL